MKLGQNFESNHFSLQTSLLRNVLYGPCVIVVQSYLYLLLWTKFYWMPRKYRNLNVQYITVLVSKIDCIRERRMSLIQEHFYYSENNGFYMVLDFGKERFNQGRENFFSEFTYLNKSRV